MTNESLDQFIQDSNDFAQSINGTLANFSSTIASELTNLEVEFFLAPLLKREQGG